MSSSVHFQGRRYEVSAPIRLAILELAYQAQAKVLGGIKPGDLRWSHPARDFFWHDETGAHVFMDAYQLIALARRVMEHNEELRLKDTAPAPMALPRAPRISRNRSIHPQSCKENTHAYESGRSCPVEVV